MAVKGITIVEGQQLTASTATYYTAGTNRTRIDKMTICNTTGTARTFDLHIVPSGGAASASNQVIDAKSVGAGETYLCPEVVGHWLEPGDTIQAVASAASALSIVASGIEVN